MRVVVMGLGGTIAMSGSSGGVTPSLSTAELLAAVPGLAATGIDLETLDFRRLPGSALAFADLDELLVAVGKALDAGADGVVVTQGTDTIEESAYYLDLHHGSPEPLVVTGAMRNPTLAGADGPANLLAAIQTAADAGARDRGCLVVFADEIHAAARVRKTHATSLATFQSPDAGPLGHVVEGRPRWVAPAERGLVLPAEPRPEATPRVALVTVTLGDDESVLDGLAARCDGLVVAAMGVGHVPTALVEPLTALAQQMPVVLASRTGAGSVLSGTYGYPGSERDLLARGLISAGLLHPFKARVLLHALLTAGRDLDGIKAALASSA